MLRELMKSFTVGLILLVSLSCYAQTSSKDEATFIKLQHEWAEARKARDIGFLERFYAAEFTVGNMSGSENSREQDISMFSSGDLKPDVITDSEVSVRRYGKAVVVTGLEHLEGTYKGHSGQFDLRFTNVFIYRSGRWQLVRHQATPLQKKP